MQHVNVRELGRQPVGELARAVRRGVVDHEHPTVEGPALEDLTERTHHRLEVLDLVVGRQAEDEPHPHIIAGWPGRCPRTPSSRTASSISPTFSSSTGPTRFGSPPTAGLRPGSATPRHRWRAWLWK